MWAILTQNLNPCRWVWPQKWRARAYSGGVAEQTDTDDTGKEFFEVVARSLLREDEVAGSNGGRSEFQQGSVQNGAASDHEAGGEAKEGVEIDWEMVPRMRSEELECRLQGHPMDPHKPNFSELLPVALRPYPSFEGWFIRILDPEKEFSAAVIIATNYATDESQVTVLFAPGKDVDREGSSGVVKYGYTYAVAVKTKDAKFTRKEDDQEWGDKKAIEPKGFEWEASGIGRIVVTPHVTDFDFTVEGYNFKAHLTKELLWDAYNSEKGPEGWARYVSIIPTHWYVYSLGSTVNYSFSNPGLQIYSEGSAFGHVEKNWGLTFPAGHVWLQAFSCDNTRQVCCAGAYFKTPDEKLSSPHIFVLGYRSLDLQLDFRTNDLGILFKDVIFSPLDSSFSLTAVGPSHTVEVKAYAPYDTFSDPVLAPATKLDWKPTCRESYVATAELKVYEHLAWGISGTKSLCETQNFKFAALEFGEDLLAEALDGAGNQV